MKFHELDTTMRGLQGRMDELSHDTQQQREEHAKTRPDADFDAQLKRGPLRDVGLRLRDLNAAFGRLVAPADDADNDVQVDNFAIPGWSWLDKWLGSNNSGTSSSLSNASSSAAAGTTYTVPGTWPLSDATEWRVIVPTTTCQNEDLEDRPVHGTLFMSKGLWPGAMVPTYKVVRSACYKDGWTEDDYAKGKDEACTTHVSGRMRDWMCVTKEQLGE